MTYEEWLDRRANNIPNTPQSFYDEDEDIFCGGGCEEEEPD